MRRLRTALLLASALVSASIAARVNAETRANPYLAAVDRNSFGLKPVPLPPPEPPPAPVIPSAKVVLTGITTIFSGGPRALVEISEQESGKPATVRKPILREGERDGSVEVVMIDIAKSIVRIKNGIVETNITFEVAKATGPGPGTPGALSPPAQMAAGTQGHTAGGSPTIISPGGANMPGRQGTGVATFGGSGAIPAPVSNPNASYARSSFGNSATAFNTAGVNTYGAPDPTRPIPARELRTDEQPLVRPPAADTMDKLNQAIRDHGLPALGSAPSGTK